MVEKKVAVRIVSEGGKLLKAEFADIGREGTRALQSIEREGGRSGAALQNVGFQVQDFAVQVAGGTSASRALAQQLPQLLSGFGMMGVVLGTAAAVLVPLISYMLGGADAAKTLAGQLKALNDASSAYAEAAEANKASIVELREEYRGLADEIKMTLDLQELLTRNAAKRAQTAAAGGVFGEITQGMPGLSSVDAINQAVAGYDALIRKRADLQAAMSQTIAGSPAWADASTAFAEVDAQVQTLDQIAARLTRLGEIYGATAEEARGLVIAAAELNNADPGAAQAEAASRLLAMMVEIFGSVEAVNAQFAGMTDTLTAIIQKNAELEKMTDQTGIFAGIYRDALDHASTILDGAADKYGPIIANIKAAARAAWDWAAASAAALAAGQEAGSLDAAGSQTDFGLGSRARRPAPRKPFELGVPDLPKAGGGGGGGGMSDAQKEQNDLMREAERVIAATRTEAEKYADELGRLNDMLKEGYLNQDQYDRALAELKDKFGDLDEEAKKTKDAFKDFFGSILSGSASAEEALGRLLESFATEMFSTGFDSLWGVLFPSANGNVFSGGDVVPFANGGVVSSPTTFPMRHGRIGLMGEAGPEAIMPLKRGRDGKLGVAAGGAADGAVSVTVQVNVDARGAVDGVAAQVADAVRKQIPDIVQQAVAGVGAARRRGYAV